MIGVEAADVERFREVVTRVLGLQFDDAKLGVLGDLLRRRLEATRQGTSVYLRQLDGGSEEEILKVAQELTVAETYFFRHMEQYRAFAEVAVPDRLRQAQAAGVRMQVLSAGCASGEEPYSLAITIRNAFANPGAISILGLDINPVLLEKAARGRFSPWVLRDTPEEVQRRWFRPEGREFVLDETLRGAVRFEVCNLARDLAQCCQPESFDVVFCRNVLMYFAPAMAQAVIERLTRALRPGGYLFLGHAETLRGLSNDFHLRHTHGTFYYQRKDRLGAGDTLAPAVSTPAAQTDHQLTLSDVVSGAPTWIAAIQQASARIEALAESPKSPAASCGPLAPVKTATGVAFALELLRQERFAEALELVRSLPPEVGRNADILLLHAVLLTHSGQFVDAERVCEQLLKIDELNAGAHYLLALCREGVGDRRGAVYHDQVAIYVDPGFAMAHLHLGLLARRAHDRPTAQRELEQAIALLEREDAARLLLFGGGFGREALAALCRSELFREGHR
jgi:chemotaxis protein methyltransferase CheR